MLKTQVEEVEKNKVLLKVEVTSHAWQEAIAEAYAQLAAKMKVPGFRRGKVPRRVVEARVGRQAILEEALKNKLPVYYMKAIKASKIKPIDRPKIEMVQFEEEKPLIFHATVDVEPKVKLGKYKKIKMARESSEVTDEEVNRQLDLLRDRFAQLEVVEGRPIREKDFALINFDGYIDGKPFEGGSAKDYLLEIGSGFFVPGFEEQLVGARKGEIRDIWVQIPKNHQAKEIAGKKVRFKVLVKEIKQKKLPTLDDKFAKEVSDFDTLEELKADIKKSLKKVKENQVEAKLRLDVLKVVSEGSEVEIPEIMIKSRVEQMLRDLNDDFQRKGFTLEEYLKSTRMTEEDLKKSFREDALKGIKNRLVLEAIAEEEGLEVSEEEIDNEVRVLAKRLNKDYNELRERIEKEGNTAVVREELVLRKTLKFLTDNAEIVARRNR